MNMKMKYDFVEKSFSTITTMNIITIFFMYCNHIFFEINHDMKLYFANAKKFMSLIFFCVH